MCVCGKCRWCAPAPAKDAKLTKPGKVYVWKDGKYIELKF